MTSQGPLVTPRQSGNASPELPPPLPQELWPHFLAWPGFASACVSGSTGPPWLNASSHGLCNLGKSFLHSTGVLIDTNAGLFHKANLLSFLYPDLTLPPQEVKNKTQQTSRGQLSQPWVDDMKVVLFSFISQIKL